MNNLYLPAGWLNIPYVAQLDAWLIVILGSRQIGKTYGTLLYMLDNNIRHILLRRTTAEIDMITADTSLSPYKVYEPDYKVGIFKKAKKLAQICDYAVNKDDEKVIIKDIRGIATSLAEISHIRGFNGSVYSDLIFDEFIPEKSVITRKTEGDAFLNAYATINGNRELEGKPPLRAWLLANTNNINSSILEALNLTDIVLTMQRKGQELYCENGIAIILPRSEAITDLRKQTALMKQVSRESEFYGMALENRFSYDENIYIKQRSIKHMKPAWSYGDLFYAWDFADGFYICRAKFTKGGMRYAADQVGREKLSREWAILKNYYYADMMLFSDLRVLAFFKNIFDID